MEFAEKKAAYNELLGEQHHANDATLLKKLYPDSNVLKVPAVDKKQAQSDVLWELLDKNLATPDEISKNRKPVKKLETPEDKSESLEQQRKDAERVKLEAKMQAERDLLGMDLPAAKQRAMAKIARAIPEIAESAKNFKGKTLLPLLIAYKEKISKPATNGNTNNEELEADKQTTDKTSTDSPEKKSE